MDKIKEVPVTERSRTFSPGLTCGESTHAISPGAFTLLGTADQRVTYWTCDDTVITVMCMRSGTIMVGCRLSLPMDTSVDGSKDDVNNVQVQLSATATGYPSRCWSLIKVPFVALISCPPGLTYQATLSSQGLHIATARSVSVPSLWTLHTMAQSSWHRLIITKPGYKPQ